MNRIDLVKAFSCVIKRKGAGKAQEDFSKYLLNTFVLNTH